MSRVGRRSDRCPREAGGEESAVRGALDHGAGAAGPPEVPACDVSSDTAFRTGTWLRFARHELSRLARNQMSKFWYVLY